ncbi:metallophosphoesterase [Halobacillus sp. A5]|uniref:metallophosphoesterase n=1 Tax=Halobacillus sp. A5 TaxID=2880263 RepID=UPI0020A69979|nr:metallophosphoesterase [Halobacillus sp. A5]MCP3027350.1 metallophosphoesterase [Halobacillus sp. A5]
MKKNPRKMTTVMCTIALMLNFLLVTVPASVSAPDITHAQSSKDRYETVYNPVSIEAPFDYTFVWMSDTQYYSKRHPHIYRSMVDWITANKEKLSIPYVIHTGDIVNNWDSKEQWQHAEDTMNVLEDAEVPYGILAGNHDIELKNKDYTPFSTYFGQSQFEKQPHYGESYKDNRGHYDLLSMNGNDFIMIYMSWGITQEEIDWVNEVLEKHPDHMAFINLHQYLLPTGKRSRIGEDLFEQVVKPNENVAAILSGHYYGTAKKVDKIDDNGDGTPDRKVYQLLANYQGGPEGGQGYMRLLHVNQKENKIHVKTYSPFLDDFNYYDTGPHPGKDDFIMEIPLEP